MTERVKGRRVEEVAKLFDRFHDVLTGASEPGSDLGKLAVFVGVREFPMRVKCATLAWHTLRAALEGGGVVSTE
jgi:nitrogen fixation NifU-like protein